VSAIGAAQFVEHLRAQFKGEPRGIAVYAASWSLARAFRQPPDRIAAEICDAIVRTFPSSTILMPTFTRGFDANGLCDLDAEHSTSGIISETFRRRPEARRSRSAFFSFGVIGPERDDVVALAPREAWGDGSLYHWLLQADARIVTIGIHPTHCSFSHLVEWRHRERISYRFNKLFRGRLRIEGQETPWEEILFVRRRDPLAINDFTWLLPHFLEAGMRQDTIDGVTVSSIGAKAKMVVMDRMMVLDPLSMLKNRSEFTALPIG
jgi:hypothetical protein